MFLAPMLALALLGQFDDEKAREALRKLGERFEKMKALSCQVVQHRFTLLFE